MLSNMLPGPAISSRSNHEAIVGGFNRIVLAGVVAVPWHHFYRLNDALHKVIKHT